MNIAKKLKKYWDVGTVDPGRDEAMACASLLNLTTLVLVPTAASACATGLTAFGVC